MATKTYIAITKLTVPYVQNGKIQRYISFCDEKNTFSTDDEKIQKALESLPVFGKYFKLLHTKQAENEAELLPQTKQTRPEEPPKNTIFPEQEIMEQITDWQSAREILKNPPYNVPYQALSSPEAILKKAEENRLSFPNLNLG